MGRWRLPQEGPGFCDVELRVVEKKPLHITAGTYMNSNEGALPPFPPPPSPPLNTHS